jgi:hypothetical protein
LVIRIVSACASSSAIMPVISFSNDSGVAGGGTYLMGYTPAQSIERVVDYVDARSPYRPLGTSPAKVVTPRPRA